MSGGDFDLLAVWSRAFFEEAIPGEPRDDERDRSTLEAMLSGEPGRGLWLWEHDEPVSYVGYVGDAPRAGRIAPVYTPPERRGRGYATALTAHVTKDLLERGAPCCLLYTDLANPTLLHKEIIGTRGSTSDAATDHLAFNYFGTLDRLAIPMVICEESAGGGDYGDMMTFSGLMVYEVTVEGGFNELGRLPHEEPETEDTYQNACGSWWTDANSPVKRSIFMDEFVFAIAEDAIDIANIADLENPIGIIPLVEE